MPSPALAFALLLHATPTVVQIGTAEATALTVSDAMPDASTPGNALVVGVWWYTSTTDVTVSDSMGDVFLPTPPVVGTQLGLTGQIFTTTVRDAGTITLTATRTMSTDMSIIALELSGVSSHVEDFVGGAGLSPNVDGGSLNASAGAALVAWVLAYGTVGDAGAGFSVVTRFQGDLWALQIAGDAGVYALTAQSEAMPFGSQGSWLSDFISLPPLPIDAGATDAGGSDGGAPDAGTLDAGVADAGADAGVPDGGTGSRDLQTGCGCASEPSAFLVVFSLALAIAKRARMRLASTKGEHGRD